MVPCSKKPLSINFFRLLGSIGINEVITPTKFFTPSLIKSYDVAIFKNNVTNPKKQLNINLRRFSSSITPGDIIFVAGQDRAVVIAFKKLIKLLRNRGFSFSETK